MLNKVAIIGGDLRIVKLIEMLKQDGFKVYTYGLEKADSLFKGENIIKSGTLQDAISNVDIVIGPIPLSSNNVDINTPFSEESIKLETLAKYLNDKTFIAGNVKGNFYNLVDREKVKIIDLLKREELTILNTISTAEGAIQIAMEETTKTLHGSKVLIMGYGRTGKILANMLKGFGVEVSCEARKNVDLAWIKAYGYKPIKLTQLEQNLGDYDIIINTIPYMILDNERLKLVNEECLIIDLASNPGGVDRTSARNMGIKTIWALSLPGKVAPLTSAEFIKDTLYNIFREL
ncbi:MAG: dipicolinate synthase subunit DpsA [Clostridia bacterium]|nr:dipicolinate synthase subunit DpsA [Clostridia bacterium]